MPNGQIVTFYSYKGGVGRSFLLANVATLLAQWGYKVLCLDWDLEAPGLHYYFRPYMEVPQSGLVDMVLSVRNEQPVDALGHVTPVILPGNVKIDLIAAGGVNSGYVSAVQSIDWDSLYSNADFGNILEEWRNSWIDSYDIILVDSRTGISDSGGICTSQLPHILAYAFTANQQNLDGVLDVVARAAEARNGLPYDRSRLLTLPLLCRFDMSEEYERATEWRQKLGTELKPSYNAWVPESSGIDRVIDNCTVPYSAYWSFGEELPVLSEDIRNPRLVSYSIASIASLLAHKLEDIALFTESRDAYVDGAIRIGRRGGEYRNEVFISGASNMMHEARELSRLLTAEGVSTFFPWEQSSSSDSYAWGERLRAAIDTSQHFVLLIRDGMKTQQRDELNYFLRQTLDEHSDRKVFPVVASRDAVQGLPSIVKGVTTYSLSDNAPISIARMIKNEISEDGHLDNSAAHHQLGLVALNRGDLRTAERHYRNALAIDEGFGDQIGVATNHRQLGMIAQLRGDYRQAEYSYRNALSIFEDLGDRAGIAATHLRLGVIAQLRGDYRQAEYSYRNALSIFEDLGDRAGIATTHLRLGVIAQERRKYQEAEYSYRNALSIFEDLGDRAGIATTHLRLGGIAQERGDHQQAENHYRNALTTFEDLGDRASIAATHLRLGGIAQERRKYQEAEYSYRNALSIFEDLGDRAGIATTHLRLGGITQERGDHQQAENHYRNALSIFEDLDDRAGIATTHLRLGGIAQERGDHQQAENHYRNALSIFEDLDDRAGIAATHLRLGVIAQERRKYQEAEYSYRNALSIFEDLGDRAGIATTHLRLGGITQERGDHQQAENHYRNALTTFEDLDDRASIATTHGQLGALRTVQGRLSEGVPYTLQALAIQLEIGSPPDASLYWLSRQRALLGDDAFKSTLDELLPGEASASLMNAIHPEDEPMPHDEPADPSDTTGADPA
ncbi:tetratricopeptide repeat protein [Streptomyces sp. GTA36]